MEKLKEGYKEVNPNAEIEIQQSDSTTGMESTVNGICDIGMASRELKDSEIEAGLKGQEIALDGIAGVFLLEEDKMCFFCDYFLIFFFHKVIISFMNYDFPAVIPRYSPLQSTYFMLNSVRYDSSFVPSCR